MRLLNHRSLDEQSLAWPSPFGFRVSPESKDGNHDTLSWFKDSHMGLQDGVGPFPPHNSFICCYGSMVERLIRKNAKVVGSSPINSSSGPEVFFGG